MLINEQKFLVSRTVRVVKTLENFKMVPLLFAFSIYYLAFMCNAVCDMETSIISCLSFDFEFNEDNSKLTRSTQRAQTSLAKADH